MINNSNYHVAWCPFCNQGWVDIIKDSLTSKLFLLCAECDTLWDDPIDVELGNPIVSKMEINMEEPILKEIKDNG
ncbi:MULTISPECIES: hypothetical protein [Mucilaginibacter]|mgnify:CR=1 FL=1|jgi:hypothetical protein|uniref:hypothetical protein n=1 Tax=Mucilaginibacter TaxID=423349 RepID=UPI001669A358|nr:hypothetical protein [Mucilaginibacter rubeus]GGB27778.1 hypothetical protein GCM10011500_50070 [Mucilaginibacter rubeus]